MVDKLQKLSFPIAVILIIGALEKILSINAVSEAGRLTLTGIIIVSAVLLQRRGK